MKESQEIIKEIDENFLKYIKKYKKRLKLYTGTTEQTLKERLSDHPHKDRAVIHTLFNFGKLTNEEENDINLNKENSKYYQQIRNSETHAIQMIKGWCNKNPMYSCLNINQKGGGLRHNKEDIHKIYLLLK